MRERIMKQAVMRAPGRIEFQDVPVPKPQPGEVLLRVNRIGVCGSDVHVYHGEHQYVEYPLIQGHELAAEIVEVGEQVQGFSAGQKVTIQPQSYCGRCYQCTHGSYHICENLKVMGFQLPGCAREFMAVPQEKLIELPAELSLDQGALIEPVAVAVHAIGRTGSIRDKRVLVLGAGTIGNLVAQAAAGLGAGVVAVTDVIDSRLRLARRCGVAHCLSSSAADVSGKIADAFGADGADVVFDCAGVPATIIQAVDSSHKGADIIIVAVFPADTVVNLGAVQRRELRLIGTHMYQKKDFELGIDLVRAGKIVLEPLITTHFDFEDYPSAYRYIDEKTDETMKVIIHVS
jgi:L-iditol 2-dehydrogenase